MKDYTIEGDLGVFNNFSHFIADYVMGLLRIRSNILAVEQEKCSNMISAIEKLT